MAVWEFKVELKAEAVALAEDWLAEMQEQRLMLLEDRISGRAWLTGYFESAEGLAAAKLTLATSPLTSQLTGEPVVRQLADADWKESYRLHFQAWRFGSLAWVPVWEREVFVAAAGEQVLWLDPGMAFGTGNHETTRLCCERLVEFAAARGTRGRVIDAGCGSGILALSAARLGFGGVRGFDNDPEAIRVSAENAALNGLTGAVEFTVDDLETGLRAAAADLLMANIQADVLKRFAREICAAVAPGGTLVLSGILGHELATVAAAFAEIAPGWRQDSRVKGEWADLSLVRPPT